jgi:hypothetical protein
VTQQKKKAPTRESSRRPRDSSLWLEAILLGAIRDRPKTISELRADVEYLAPREVPCVERVLQRMRRKKRVLLLLHRWALPSVRLCRTCEGRGWTKAAQGLCPACSGEGWERAKE